MSATPWWTDAVVYQIYPRSFQDSNGDGIGDLPGITSRLDHLAWLGVDALWLSPIYPSPLADLGYDVSDYTDVAPEYGTLADLDALIAAAHERDIRVLLDLIPSHTSIEHPWFRAHPERYVWADEAPPNNWVAAFGGPAWSLDPESPRFYLHSFYPEQPDLDWRNPEVRMAFAEIIRFWIDRGVDGFRLDALDRLAKDPSLRDNPPASKPFGLPLPDEYGALEPLHSSNGPEIGIALAAIREAAGDCLLVGEVYLPTDVLGPYLEHLDLAFAFELLHSSLEAARLREVIDSALRLGQLAWVLSNHDFPRLVTRLGHERAGLAAMLLLTLPGAAFIYQGDEIGMADGPGAVPPIDRAGRDAHRHPMQWDATPAGGFSEGPPWLPPADPAEINVAGQRGAEGSLLELYRELIRLRRSIAGPLEWLDAGAGVLAFRRGEHSIFLNLGDAPATLSDGDPPLLASSAHAFTDDRLAPSGGVILRRLGKSGERVYVRHDAEERRR